MASKEKLQNLFDSYVGYAFEKIREGIQDPVFASIAEGCLEKISELINEVKSRAVERELIDNLPGVSWDSIEAAEKPARRLKAYFAGETPLDKEDALVYADYLQVQVNELEALAKMIDEGT